MRPLAIVAGLVLLSNGCSAQQPPASSQNTIQNVLIVYLSRTSNTKAVAEMIQRKVGGAMVALELESPYPADYRAIVQQVAEENESGYLPPLKTRIPNIAKYDVVFLGYPTWGMQLPPPIKSFLRSVDLRGKTVIPFNTNAGYGEGSALQTIRELCRQCTVLKSFSTRGGIERDGVLLDIRQVRADAVEKEVEVWLRTLKLGSANPP